MLASKGFLLSFDGVNASALSDPPYQALCVDDCQLLARAHPMPHQILVDLLQ